MSVQQFTSTVIVAATITDPNYGVTICDFLDRCPIVTASRVLLMLDFDLPDVLKAKLPTKGTLQVLRCVESDAFSQWKQAVNYLTLNDESTEAYCFVSLDGANKQVDYVSWMTTGLNAGTGVLVDAPLSSGQPPKMWALKAPLPHTKIYTDQVFQMAALPHHVVATSMYRVLTQVPQSTPTRVIQIVTTEGQWMVFEEIMRGIRCELKAKGHSAFIGLNTWMQGHHVITICLGSHCYPYHWQLLINKACIIYNLEQLSDSSPYNQPGYLSLLSKARVWDYNKFNQKWLLSKGIQSQYFPIGYSSAYLYAVPPVPEHQKTNDVLFFGSMNAKRVAMLSPIANDTSIRSIIGVPMFFNERAKAVQNSKILINLHFYDMARLEISRIGPLLANGCFVITQPGCDAEENQLFVGGVVFINDANELYQKVKYYLQNPEERNAIAQRGRVIYQSMPMSVPLIEA